MSVYHSEQNHPYNNYCNKQKKKPIENEEIDITVYLMLINLEIISSYKSKMTDTRIVIITHTHIVYIITKLKDKITSFISSMMLIKSFMLWFTYESSTHYWKRLLLSALLTLTQ